MSCIPVCVLNIVLFLVESEAVYHDKGIIRARFRYDDSPVHSEWVLMPFSSAVPHPSQTISGGNQDSRFDVGKGSGTIIVARPLDVEQRSSYNLTVEATDGTRSISTQVIDITKDKK